MLMYRCGEDVRITDMRGDSPVTMRLNECAVDMGCAFEMPEITLRGTLLRAGTPFPAIRKIPSGMEYKRIVFNPPATIVLWADGTKTVVKCDDRDNYDRRTGLALCFMKKALGNKSRALNDVLHKELTEVDGEG